MNNEEKLTNDNTELNSSIGNNISEADKKAYLKQRYDGRRSESTTSDGD